MFWQASNQIFGVAAELRKLSYLYYGRHLRKCPRLVSPHISFPRGERSRASACGSKLSNGSFLEVVGTSTKSWEDAAQNAVETAAKTLRDLRIAEVVKMDMKVKNGKIQAFRTRVLLSFKYGD